MINNEEQYLTVRGAATELEDALKELVAQVEQLRVKHNGMLADMAEYDRRVARREDDPDRAD